MRQLEKINADSLNPVERLGLRQAKESKISSQKEGIKSGEEKLKMELRRIECQQKHIDVAAKGYPNLLDIRLLGLNQECPGFGIGEKKAKPAFVVTPINNPSGEVKIERFSCRPSEVVTNCEPELPGHISFYFKKSFLSWRFFHETIEIRGVMPREARVALDEAVRSKLFDQIFLIAEVNEGNGGTTRVANKGAVIGGYIEKTGQLFLITHYEMIPPDEYLNSLLSPS